MARRVVTGGAELGSAHCGVMCGAVASTACGPAEDVPRLRRRPPRHVHRTRRRRGRLRRALADLRGQPPPPRRHRSRRLGLHLAGIASVLTKVERIGLPLWKRIAPLTKRPLHAALLGAVWGFVPCGRVYAAASMRLAAWGARARARAATKKSVHECSLQPRRIRWPARARCEVHQRW